MPPLKDVQFREAHTLKYGLEVVARDAISNRVKSVLCLFCRHYGRELRPGQKRKSSPNFKYFLAFRNDLYNQHLRSQHPKMWEKYSKISDQEKQSFFPKDLTRPEPDKKKLCTTKDVVEAATASKGSDVEKFCWFLLPKRIVDVLVPPAALGGDRSWQPPNFRACEVVELTKEDGQGTEKYYQVALFVRMELDVAVDSLASGLSPRQAARHLAALARRTTGAGAASPSFPLLKTEKVRELGRLAMSESMKITGQLLTRTWGFGLVLREVTAAPDVPSAGYLDVRVVVYAQGKLRDIHVIALPLVERRTALSMARAIECVLDGVSPSWRTRVLGISQDGCIGNGAHQAASADRRVAAAFSLTECPSEVLALLETSIKASPPTTPRRVLYRTWGACRQVSLALASFYDSLLGGGFLSVWRTLTAYIQKNPVLLREMGQPPSHHVERNEEANLLNASVDLKVDSEWLAMGLDAQWITDKRVRLRKYLDLNSVSASTTSSSSSSPTGATTRVDDAWWVAFFVVHWISTRANEAFEKLQLGRISRVQQAETITDMTTELTSTFVIQGDQQPEGQELPYFSRQGKFSILKSSVHEFLCNQGIFVSNVVNKVAPAALDTVLENLAICLVNLAESMSDLGAILPGTEAELPPILPHQLAQLSGREFTALLNRHGEQLRAFYSDEELDTVEQEYQALHRAATRDSELKTALASCDEDSPFASSWALAKDQFPLLQAYAGGLASAFTGRDASSNNSMVGLSVVSSRDEDIDDNGLRLPETEFTLEASLHAQQFDALSEISRQVIPVTKPSKSTTTGTTIEEVQRS